LPSLIVSEGDQERINDIERQVCSEQSLKTWKVPEKGKSSRKRERFLKKVPEKGKVLEKVKKFLKSEKFPKK
jgi:hypothetical protein